jgi:hypothetical protein
LRFSTYTKIQETDLKPRRFERRAAPSPSFNYGWRLGVSVGAAALLVCGLAAPLLLLVGKVWDVYF